MIEAGLLEGAEFDAAVDAFDGALQSNIGFGKSMRGEEFLSIVAFISGTEISDVAHEIRRHSGGELGLDFVPIVLNVGPCLATGLRVSERKTELNGGVLIAHLAGGGVVEGALDQFWILKVGEQPQSSVLDGGIGGGFSDLLQRVKESCIAMARSDSKSVLAECGID